MDNVRNFIKQDVISLAKELYKNNQNEQKSVVSWLMEVYEKAKDKDILVVHSPGGWGCANLENLIAWESSLVQGVTDTLSRMGKKWTLVQYFRTEDNFINHLKHSPELIRYFMTGKLYLAQVLAAQLEFLKKYLGNLKIILLGASQGAAFNNTVMKHLSNSDNIYSIELGIFFMHLSRRIITPRTLVIDNNGCTIDPVVHWDFMKAFRAYITAPFRWIRYRIDGEPVKFSACINVPGHDYHWQHLSVQSRITDFLRRVLITESRELIAGGYTISAEKS